LETRIRLLAKSENPAQSDPRILIQSGIENLIIDLNTALKGFFK